MSIKATVVIPGDRLLRFLRYGYKCLPFQSYHIHKCGYKTVL